jgi:hypothetical protein
MAQHTLYLLGVEITLYDENVDPDRVVEQIMEIDGVDVVSTRGVTTETVTMSAT